MGAVVVAYDASDHAERALRWAADQAVLERRRLVVVQVPAAPSSASWEGAVADLDAGTEQRARFEVAVARARVAESHPGIEVTTSVPWGDVREVLLAASAGAHLLVMGSRGHGPVSSLLLGSVSVAVTRHARCTVVVTRPLVPGRVRDGVLVGADATAASRPVLEFAYRQASARRLPLTVVHGYPRSPVGLARAGLGPTPEESLQHHAVLLAESLAGLAETYPDVHVTRRLEDGLAAEVLRRNARPWDLVVVGHRPRAGIEGWVGTSVATAVLEHAQGPVAVVPEPPAGEPSP